MKDEMEDDKQSNFPEVSSGDQEINPIFDTEDSFLESFGQLTLNEQFANDIPQTEVTLLNPDAKWITIQQHIVLYLHAYRCMKREELCSGPYDCSLPHCSKMKSVLLHVKTCLIESGCTILLCSSTKKIISHWELCQREHCPACFFIRIADKIGNNSDSGITLNSRPNEASANRASTSAAAGVGAACSSEFNLLPSLPIIDLNLPEPPRFVTNSDHEHLLAQSYVLEPFLLTKEWHHLMSANRRHEQVTLFVLKILPFCNEGLVSDQMIKNLITYGEFAEIDAYRTADSIHEYIELIKEEAYKMIEKIAEEKSKLNEMN